MTCSVEIDQSEYEEIRKHDYVVLREWESVAGHRFAKLAYWGSKEECEDITRENDILIVPNDVKYIGDQVVKVKDLLSPTEETK